MQNSSKLPVLKVDTLNPQVVEAKYAVRGEILTIKNAISEEFKQGIKYPFTEFCELNIGNPQTFKMKPITFFREVIAAVTCPSLLDKDCFSEDVKNRAREYLTAFKSVGCYSASPGNPLVCKSIASFIENRDGVKVDPSNVIVYNGASEAIASLMTCINVPGGKTGFMIPIPQYPLYSAQAQLNGAEFVGYYLDEDAGWELDEKNLNDSYDEAQKNGVNVKAIIIINPGNPTGAIFSRKSLETLFKFAHSRGVVVLADEVYQENIYTSQKKFESCRKVLSEMDASIRDSVELFSFHSTSKGFMGECGARGGYMEMHNISADVKAVIHKLKTISLCSNIYGQLMMDLKVRPPTTETCSKETVDQYTQERDALLDELKKKATIVEKALNSMTGIHVNPIEGAMYAFPRIELPAKFVEEARSLGKEPDALYCIMALKQTGAVMVPGSGFKQKPGTYHFRTTILPSPVTLIEEKYEEVKKFHEDIIKKYS